MPYAHSTGATIHYLTAPARPTCPPGTPCVVFIHGGGGSAYVWLHQLPFFAASGFYAVSLSVRGWGQSRLEVEDAELFSSGYLAEDVCCVLDAVGARRAALVGHSIGGFWCARMLAEWPDRVTHCVFSNTFYGLVDDSDVSKFGERWISRYVDRGAGPADAVKGPGRDDIADAVKDALKPPDSLRVSRTQAQGRSRYPTPPDNFSERFRAERPEMCWLFDATNDGNAQVAALGLKRRFRALHAEGAIGPAKLRARRDRGARLFSRYVATFAVGSPAPCSSRRRSATRPCTGNWSPSSRGNAPATRRSTCGGATCATRPTSRTRSSSTTACWLFCRTGPSPTAPRGTTARRIC